MSDVVKENAFNIFKKCFYEYPIRMLICIGSTILGIICFFGKNNFHICLYVILIILVTYFVYTIHRDYKKERTEAEKNRELAREGQEKTQLDIDNSIRNDPDFNARQNIVKKMLDKNVNHKDYPNLIIMIDELFKDKAFEEKIIIKFSEYDEYQKSLFKEELIRYLTNPILESMKQNFIKLTKINSHNSIFQMLHLIPYALINLKEKKYHDILNLDDGNNESKIFNNYIDYALDLLKKN